MNSTFFYNDVQKPFQLDKKKKNTYDAQVEFGDFKEKQGRSRVEDSWRRGCNMCILFRSLKLYTFLVTIL